MQSFALHDFPGTYDCTEIQVDEITKLHNPDMSKEQVKARTIEMLKLVGIANSEGVYKMYPHELSGGMRRVCIIIGPCNQD